MRRRRNYKNALCCSCFVDRRVSRLTAKTRRTQSFAKNFLAKLCVLPVFAVKRETCKPKELFGYQKQLIPTLLSFFGKIGPEMSLVNRNFLCYSPINPSISLWHRNGIIPLMKSLPIYIILQFLILFIRAEDGQGPVVNAAEKLQLVTAAKLKAGATEISFRDFNFNRKHKDSFLVIYDRYDRSGAGIVKKVFYPGSDQTILVADIPAGKYFITVQRLGIHHQKFERVLKIKSLRRESVVIKLEDWDECTKEQVKLPKENTDFSKLTIFSSAKPSSTVQKIRKSRSAY